MQPKTKNKLTKTQGSVLINILLSIIMTGAMTLGMLLIQSNNYDNFWPTYWKQFLEGFCISLPVVSISAPLIQKFVGRFTEGS